MATTLTRTGLVLPAGTEFADVAIGNANMTKIDGWVGVFFCTSSTRPATPFTGQLIFETDTRLFSMYDGSAWIQFLAAGGATVHEVEYNQTVAQSIPSGTDTPLNFDSAILTSVDITRATATGGSIANGKMTLNRAGLWAIDVGMRMVSASTFSFGVWVGVDNSSAFRLGEDFQNSGGVGNIGCNVGIVRRFGAATALNAYAWQNSGSAKNTDIAGGCTHFRAAWLRP